MLATATAEAAILGNLAEQLFWMQDVATTTPPIIHKAFRAKVDQTLLPSLDLYDY